MSSSPGGTGVDAPRCRRHVAGATATAGAAAATAAYDVLAQARFQGRSSYLAWSEGPEESLQFCLMVATSTSPAPSSDPPSADSGTAVQAERWYPLRRD